jgi:predicted CXXCH cytochrome family protein
MARRLFFAALGVIIGAAILAIAGVGVALALENQDSFCASCHTEPETTYFQQSVQNSAVTLAAYHTQKKTACIDCHSGSGTFGRSVGLLQGAHDLLAYFSGNYHRPAITTNPLGDDSCVKCHDEVANNLRGGSRAMNGHYHTYLPQWQASDPNAARCVTCHTSHTKGLAGLMFMSQGEVGKLCEDCHDALSGKIR